MASQPIGKVIVTSERCEAIGYCTNIAPAMFDLPDGEPPVRVTRELFTEKDVSDATEAEEMCPTRALHMQRSPA